jgi:hypothetical protein
MGKTKLEELYDLVIDGYVINKKILVSKGFTGEDIIELLRKKYIIETEKETYKIYNADKFHKYGIKLLQEGKIKEANICFKQCHKLNPTGRKINLQMILTSLIRNNYEEVLTLYKNLEDATIMTHKLDNNLYLYLLSFIIELPQEYKEKIRELKYEDIALPKQVISKDENKVRIAIYQNKLPYACKLLNDIMAKKNDEYSLKYELLKILTYKAADAERDFKSKLLKLTKNEEYKEIIEILKEKSNTKKLNKVEMYILLTSYTIINILETKTIPEKKVTITYDIYTALMGNNFDLAKEINLEHHTLIGTDANEDPVNILLEKIIELIKDIEKTNKKIEEPQCKEIPSDMKDIDKEITESEELAYYIKSENMTLKEATKKLGLR